MQGIVMWVMLDKKTELGTCKKRDLVIKRNHSIKKHLKLGERDLLTKVFFHFGVMNQRGFPQKGPVVWSQEEKISETRSWWW
jgi:hypothetical protein